MPVPGPHEDVIPGPDTDLDAFGLNFGTIWNPASFNSATPLAADINNAWSGFNAALAIATNAATRTPTTIREKDQARKALEPILRNAIRLATNANRQGFATDAALTALNIRTPDLVRTPIPAPTEPPILHFVESRPGILQYRLTQVVGGVPVTVRRFPYGAVGVRIQETWTGNERNTTIKRVNIYTPTGGIAPGTTITARACYFTARGEVSPLCPPTSGVVN